MATKKIYTLPEIRKIIKEQKYKHCNLTNLDGETLVNYNGIGKKVDPKLDEIETRIKRLEPGIYCVTCQSNYGHKSARVKYYLGVGDYDPKQLNEGGGEPIPERKPKDNTDDKKNLLSMETALENMRELAECKGTIAQQKAEIERLKKEIIELEEELEEEPEPVAEGGEKIKSFLSDLIPIFEPVLEKHYDLQKKKHNLAEAKFLHDNGYEIPGLKKLNGAIGKTKSVKEKNKPLPDVDGEGWEEYIEYLLALDDATLETHLAQLEENTDPEYYEAVYNLVFEQEEEEEEEEKGKK